MPAAVVIPAIAAAASMGLGAYQQSASNRAAKKAQEEAMSTWKSTAYPSADQVRARGMSGRKQLSQARFNAQQNMANTLAARGFGSGSGLMAKESGEINQGWLQGLGNLNEKLFEFAKTPQWGPPGSIYGSAMPSPGGEVAGYGSDLMDTALGYYLMKGMTGGGGYGGVMKNPISGTYSPWG